MGDSSVCSSGQIIFLITRSLLSYLYFSYFSLLLTILCKVRRELYAQCLDELIRETTISCVERGLLMLRLRDEARMTLHAYMVSSVSHPSTALVRGDNLTEKSLSSLYSQILEDNPSL